MLDRLQSFELGILDWIQANLRCGFLDAVIPVITHYGIIFWIVLAVFFMCLKKYRTCGITMGAGMIMGLLIGNLILKNLIARERPCTINPIQLLIDTPSEFSFPSGHTLCSFIAATVIFCFSRRLGIPALIMAAFVAFTRLYLYVHFPTDILGGIVLAVCIAVPCSIFVPKLVEAVKRRFAKPETQENE